MHAHLVPQSFQDPNFGSHPTHFCANWDQYSLGPVILIPLFMLIFLIALCKADLVASLDSIAVADEVLSLLSASSFSIQVLINFISFDNFVMPSFYLLSSSCNLDGIRDENLILYNLASSNLIFFS